jgi:hypothetical protein
MKNAVAITGIGLILPSGTDLAALQRPAPMGANGVRSVAAVPAIEGVAKNDMRRMSNLTKFSLYAARAAMSAAALDAKGTGLFVGITHGSTTHMQEFHDYLFDYGPEMASPNSFSNGVTNAPLSSVSALCRLTDGGTTIIGYENNGLEVLTQCAQSISDGDYNACLAGSSEEYSSLVHEAYKTCGWLNESPPPFLPWPQDRGPSCGFGVSEGSTFVSLAPVAGAAQRGPRCWYAPVLFENYDGSADIVVSGAGAGPQDVYELGILAEVAKSNNGKKPALMFTRPLFGETFSLSSMLSVLVACDILVNGAQYPPFPINPALGDLYVPQQAEHARSALVVAAGRNGQISAGLVFVD